MNLIYQEPYNRILFKRKHNHNVKRFFRWQIHQTLQLRYSESLQSYWLIKTVVRSGLKVGKIKRILRWSGISCFGPARKDLLIGFLVLIINSLLTKNVRFGWILTSVSFCAFLLNLKSFVSVHKKRRRELGQYAALLPNKVSSHWRVFRSNYGNYPEQPNCTFPRAALVSKEIH